LERASSDEHRDGLLDLRHRSRNPWRKAMIQMTPSQLKARRDQANRFRKIAAMAISGSSVVCAVIMLIVGSSGYEIIVATTLLMILAELLDVNVALRGGE
jgi:hypothetical protein